MVTCLLEAQQAHRASRRQWQHDQQRLSAMGARNARRCAHATKPNFSCAIAQARRWTTTEKAMEFRANGSGAETVAETNLARMQAFVLRKPIA